MDRQLEQRLQEASRRTGRCLRLLLSALPRIFRQASNDWLDDNVPRLGAALAFYTLLSLAPTIVLAVALAALVYGQEAAQGRLASEILGAAGPEVAGRVQEAIRGAYVPRTGAIATLLGLATLAFGASSVFVELHDAMNAIWHVPSPSGRTKGGAAIRLIRDRFYSFLAVLGVGFLLLVSLILNAWIGAMRIAVPGAAAFAILYLVIAALFAALYKILPDLPLKWGDVIPGALIASLLFMLGKQLMGLYFTYASFAATYSAVGSPIIVLSWIYYSAQLLFWGAEFSKAYGKSLGSQQVRGCPD
jgi:membrane protein